MRNKKRFLGFCFTLLLCFSSMFFASCDDSNKCVTFIYNMEDKQLCESVCLEEVGNYDLFNPQREGFDFSGWYIDENLETLLNKDEIKKGSKVNLYPKWTEKVIDYVDLIYHIDGKTITETVVLNEIEEKLLQPVKEDYKFDGWYFDDKFQFKFNAEGIISGSSVELFAKWVFDGEYKVTITTENSCALTFEGETTQTITKNNVEFDDVKVIANLGYKYLYHEINGVKYYSDVISLDKVTGDTEIKVVSDFVTYELPIINIDTFGEEIKTKEDYVNMNFTMSNCEDELIDVSGGIRLRGNSTMNMPKKPYRIKFDKKQSLFDLDKAKSWVLLADYIDPSTLDNYAALTLGNMLDNLRFTATPHKVNLYLNGRFDGLYTICEQLQENEGRLDIEIGITEDMTELKDFNFFVSMDNGVIYDSTLTEEEDYFYLEEHDRYVELRYPEKEQFVSEAQFDKFFAELKVYMQYIFDIFADLDQESIEKEINIDSLIDFSIVDNVMMEFDHMKKSFNMFYTHTSENEKENNKLSFGPIWDYDASGGKPWTNGEPNETFQYSNSMKYTNVFFVALRDIPDFQARLKERYKNVGSEALTNLIVKLYEVEMGMRESLELNHKRWYQNYYDEITKDNLEFLNKILVHRKKVLDKYLGV